MRKYSLYLIFLIFTLYCQNCILIGISPERINRSKIGKIPTNDVRIVCVNLQNFYSSGIKLDNTELEKFKAIVLSIRKSLSEEFKIDWCPSTKLPLNRIDLIVRAEYGSVCFTNSNDRFWCDVFIRTFGVVPFWGNNAGYIDYKIIQDGKEIYEFEYNTDLITVGWLPLLPFIWINFFGGRYEEHIASSITKTIYAFKEDLLELQIKVISLK